MTELKTKTFEVHGYLTIAVRKTIQAQTLMEAIKKAQALEHPALYSIPVKSANWDLVGWEVVPDDAVQVVTQGDSAWLRDGPEAWVETAAADLDPIPIEPTPIPTSGQQRS